MGVGTGKQNVILINEDFYPTVLEMVGEGRGHNTFHIGSLMGWRRLMPLLKAKCRDPSGGTQLALNRPKMGVMTSGNHPTARP